jgi:hypothetical protein
MMFSYDIKSITVILQIVFLLGNIISYGLSHVDQKYS